MTPLFSIDCCQKELSFKTALELAQGMESAAKNVRQLTMPAQDPPDTATRPTATAQNPVNHIGDNAANKPNMFVIDVEKLDIMLHLASTKRQFVIDVAKLGIYEKYARAN